MRTIFTMKIGATFRNQETGEYSEDFTQQTKPQSVEKNTVIENSVGDPPSPREKEDGDEQRRMLGMSSLTLKWGTLKAWDFNGSENGAKLLKEYGEIGQAWGTAQQKDTPRQKEIICGLIDECNDPEGIYLDWDGKYISKEEAKDYVMNYGKKGGA